MSPEGGAGEVEQADHSAEDGCQVRADVTDTIYLRSSVTSRNRRTVGRPGGFFQANPIDIGTDPGQPPSPRPRAYG